MSRANAPRRPGRRRFMQAGAGLVIGFSLVPSGSADAPRPPALPGSLAKYPRLDSWLRIDASGTVTVFTGKVELGQGIVTALAQIVADELDVDIARVAMVSGDTDRCPDEGVTSGSLSIEQSGRALRAAAAEARAALLEAAAARWPDLPPGRGQEALRVEQGVIRTPDGRQVSYGALAADVSLERTASGRVAPKPAGAHRYIGKPVQRRDIPGKVSGAPMYVHDMRLPGMLYGRVVRPPAPRARLLAVDDAAVRSMPGVVALVRDGSFLAVAAEREEQAIAAMLALRASARWGEPGDLPPSGPALYPFLKSLRSEDSVVSEKKDPAALAAAQTRHAATYTRPYTAHASIGPSCAVAQWTGGRLRVWGPAQGPFQQRADLARSFDLKPADVEVIHREGSGCYGHNAADDVGLDAALLARATGGRPVKLQWMREDEFMWEPYGSAMVVEMAAALDGSGQIVDWTHELWSHTHSMRPGDPDGDNLLASWYLEQPKAPSPARNIPQPAGGGDRNAVPLYDFANQRVVNHLLPQMPIRVSALRTLGAYGNVFALESFMDELAAQAGADPVAFRLRHLKDPRARAVLERVAANANWQPGEKGAGGRGRGVAFAEYKNLAIYVAVVAQVHIDRASGRLRVEQVHCVGDAGLVINPDGLANQLEGGIVQATSWTLHESVPYDRKGMLARNWAQYPILRFPEVPRMHVELIDRPDEPPRGVGEGTHGPVAAAIANALFNATGRRCRDLPLNPERLKPLLA
jgi:nicotinate dehydrogenase subunit B